MVHFTPYDPNDTAPVGECVRCGGELYDVDEGELCPYCRKALAWYDEEAEEP